MHYNHSVKHSNASLIVSLEVHIDILGFGHCRYARQWALCQKDQKLFFNWARWWKKVVTAWEIANRIEQFISRCWALAPTTLLNQPPGLLAAFRAGAIRF